MQVFTARYIIVLVFLGFLATYQFAPLMLSIDAYTQKFVWYYKEITKAIYYIHTIARACSPMCESGNY